MSEHDDRLMSAAEAQQFARAYVIKSLLRTIVWVVVAAAVTWLFPSARWVWYVVLVFVTIAAGFAVFSFHVARKLNRVEQSHKKPVA